MKAMQLFRRNRERASDTGALLAQQAAAAAEKTQNLAEEGYAQAKNAIASVDDTQPAEDTGEALREMRATIETSIRAQPIMALAAAALTGIAIGALWRMSGRAS
jgi:ElaB/YqjD/DUF883 family membrane-anchored ribosome-binding protein